MPIRLIKLRITIPKVSELLASQINHSRSTSKIYCFQLMMFNLHEAIKTLYDYEVIFSVKNSRKLRHDAEIGSFKLILGRVYDQPGQ